MRTHTTVMPRKRIGHLFAGPLLCALLAARVSGSGRVDEPVPPPGTDTPGSVVSVPSTADLHGMLRTECVLVLLHVAANVGDSGSIAVDGAAVQLGSHSPCVAQFLHVDGEHAQLLPVAMRTRCRLPTLCVLRSRTDGFLGAFATLTLPPASLEADDGGASDLASAAAIMVSRTSNSSMPAAVLRHQPPSALLPPLPSLSYPLRVISGGLCELQLAAAAGDALLVLLSAPWCAECRHVETQLRYAASQLRLRHRTTVGALIDVEAEGGAQLAAELAARAVPGSVWQLPTVLVVHGTSVWKYEGALEAAPMVTLVSRRVTGRGPTERPGERSAHGTGGGSASAADGAVPAGASTASDTISDTISSFGAAASAASAAATGRRALEPLTKLLMRLPAPHLTEGGRVMAEPAGSHVVTLTAANITVRLGGAPPLPNLATAAPHASTPVYRPHAPLALLLLYGGARYGASCGPDTAVGASGGADASTKLQRHFRDAAAMVEARGLGVPFCKAFVGAGEAGEAGEAGKAGKGGKGGKGAEGAEGAEGADLESPGWSAALRAVLARAEDPYALTAAVQQSLPRLVLLRHGRYRLWSNPVESPYDLVDVIVDLAARMPPAPPAPPPPPPVLPLLPLGTPPPPPPAIYAAEIVPIMAANLSHYARSKPLLLVTFTTRWCRRCASPPP